MKLRNFDFEEDFEEGELFKPRKKNKIKKMKSKDGKSIRKPKNSTGSLYE
jgi:hypothetical protein